MALIFEKIGKYIQEIDVRNKDYQYDNLIGVTINKCFIPSVANVVGTDLSNYKVIQNMQFACSLMQVSRDGGIAVSLYKNDNPSIMSPAYHIFEVNSNQILPEYLELLLNGAQFDRAAVFFAIGGVRGTLTWDEFCDMLIPVPSIQEQEKMLQVYMVISKRIEILNKLVKNLEKQAYIRYELATKNSTLTCKIKELGEFVRGKNITAEEMNSGEYEVISAGIYPSGFHNDYNVSAPSITISGSGVNAGYFSIHHKNIWAADCSYTNTSNFIYYLYNSLIKAKAQIELLKDGNSAQPHVYAKDVNELVVPYLDLNQLMILEKELSAYYSCIFKYKEQMRILDKIRKIYMDNLQRYL